MIGLLPMPGGAIFSAPMIEASVRGTKLTPAQKSASNYWFRHIWEYWLPLYPGVLLALSLSGVPAARYILIQMPMTLVALLGGWLVILRRIHFEKDIEREWSRRRLTTFLGELLPILIVVLTVIVLAPVGERLAGRFAPDSKLLKQFGVAVGIVAGAVWLIRRRGLTARTIWSLTWSKNVGVMLFLVLGIVVFQGVFRKSGAVEAVHAQFEQSGVPLIAVISIVPFLCGLLIGIAVGFVGSSYPIIVALLAGMSAGENLPYYFLAYNMGYIGMMLSPVHICLILTNQYFKSSLARVYAYLIPLALIDIVFVCGLFLLYRRFL
jgi:integral membrane protein (TIGR00529 family)